VKGKERFFYNTDFGDLVQFSQDGKCMMLHDYDSFMICDKSLENLKESMPLEIKYMQVNESNPEENYERT